MQKYRWQILIALLGLILIAGILFLILRDGEQEISTPQPVSGGAFIEAEIGSCIRLNPLLDFNNQVDRDIDALLFSGLLKFNSSAIPQPDLAEGWAVSADSTLYTFYLRENALWHDGQPVTADDVIFTYSKFMDEDYSGPSYLKDFWSDITITKIDTNIVQFGLPEPFAPFLDYLSIGLLPDHLLRGVSASDLIDHPFNLNPIGTGPYKFDHFLIEENEIQGISLVVNEDYYSEVPFLQRFEFYFFDNTEGAVNAVLTGEAQGLMGIELEYLQEILDAPSLNLHSAPVPSLYMVLFNLDHPKKTFLNEKVVRQAMMLALNRQHMIDEVFQGQAVPANSLFLDGTWAAMDPPSGWEFDPDEANRLLDAEEWDLPAGAAQGTEEYVRGKEDQTLTFTLIHADDSQSQQIAEMIQLEWASIGIRIELNALSSEEMVSDYLEPRTYQAALVNYNFNNSPDPDPYPFWHDAELDTGQNYSNFSDRNISIWLEQARTTPDVLRRSALYKRFLYRFNDLLPGLPLFFPVESYVVDTTVQGITIGPLFDPSYRFHAVQEWYLVARNTIPEAVDSSAEEIIEP
ncbi:MAG: peptide ABC transporter substrate-binding protein [Anaerolineales bacterium]|nr:peptide ABC transporter substrate-binding protein [Anaerolineales bacterium]